MARVGMIEFAVRILRCESEIGLPRCVDRLGWCQVVVMVSRI